MARITVEDCQERVDNRFLLVQMAIKRVYQYREGYEGLVDTRNKEVVTALREIAAGKIFPEDMTYYNPLEQDDSQIEAQADLQEDAQVSQDAMPEVEASLATEETNVESVES